MSELRNLKSRIEELETDLRERDEEVKVLKENANSGQQQTNGDHDSEVVKVTKDFINANKSLIILVF